MAGGSTPKPTRCRSCGCGATADRPSEQHGRSTVNRVHGVAEPATHSTPSRRATARATRTSAPCHWPRYVERATLHRLPPPPRHPPHHRRGLTALLSTAPGPAPRHTPYLRPHRPGQSARPISLAGEGGAFGATERSKSTAPTSHRLPRTKDLGRTRGSRTRHGCRRPSSAGDMACRGARVGGAGRRPHAQLTTSTTPPSQGA